MALKGGIRGRAVAVALCVLVPFASYYLAPWFSSTKGSVINYSSFPKFNSTGRDEICISLATVLPDSVYSDHHPTYQKSVNSYWSLTACNSKPFCVVKPTNAQEVAAAIKVLKAQYDNNTTLSSGPVKFAVRSGGHSPEAGFASINNGIIIDLSLINEVTLSQDERSVTIGVGARWLEVYSKLDAMNLAIVGGRNSNVGVGGLVLGGGISFFSNRYGMVCDNIDAYEIVLANGTIVQVTSSQHADLWRALKGGTGNFGIVTRVTAPTFAAGKIWAGYAYWAQWQSDAVLEAFSNFNKPEDFDEYAAGPILALSYVQSVGVKALASSLVYTKPEKWPRVFRDFNSIWRLWSTTKVQSLGDATRELDRLTPSGQRQFQVTTTIRNDLETLKRFNEIYGQKLKEVKGVKGSIWSLVFQALSAAATHKGSPNVLGLETRQREDTMVIALIAVSWQDVKDDELVHRVSREIIAMCEEFAQQQGTADQFRYLNYAASGQDPIGGYGAANKQFMQEVSRRYDPDGFFQQAKQGGFKLDLY